ncbi:hypothetical protein SAMN05216344_104215 [Polaromonas sp. OV174]|uniref:hypothetical protein n=1 Tax=Polaromonas sp. OV174 TaxID=1855300 RepID=UPI0008E99685|nr:hypothetical protein [Polaromonas sp. OV174]SFB86667.1 hypothetical protein SAMN05216344_104215 [Polaromonas sp. OV174]
MSGRILVTASLFALVSAGAVAGVSETASATAHKASGVATKVEGAVKRGVGKAAGAVEHGGAVAGKAVNRTAGKLGLPASAASSPSFPPNPNR